MDTLGFGFQFNRVETEYKWLANGFKEPVLQIVKRAGGMGPASVSVSWIDTLHAPNNSINQIESLTDLEIYPNPAKEKINIRFSGNSDSKFKISIISFTGQLIREELFDSNNMGNHIFSIGNLNLKSGIYAVKISNSKNSVTKKMIIE